MGSRTRAITHAYCAGHRMPAGHPEQPARLEAVLRGLEQAGIVLEEASPARDEDILRIHSKAYWNDLVSREPSPGGERVFLDPDTSMVAGSLRAARLAAGAACGGVRQALSGNIDRIFCATRPPGHHAEAARAMGFCLINHVAVAAALALEQPGIGRVAIADFDVHHGNGTQAIVERDPRISFASSHQSPLYPGTGLVSEIGCGNIHNAPLPAGANGQDFRETWAGRLLPALAACEPDLVLVSAGFDGHRADPLAQMELREEDYRWIGEQLAALADRYAQGRLVAVLEGGYHLEALQDSVAAFVEGFG